jgi:hypothetical protein
MKFSTLAAPAVSVLAIASGSAACAEVSAQEVWDSWKANLGSYGAEGITIGAEDYSGGVLTVSDIAISIADETGSANATIASIEFAEQGDGTVSVTMSEEVPISITSASSDGTGEMAVEAAVRQQDLEMLVSGTADEMTYDISATRLALDLDSVGDGTATGSGSIVFNDLAGTYSVTTTDMQTVDSDLSAGSLGIGLNIDDPAEDVVFSMKGSIKDISSTGTMVSPLPENTTPDTVLVDGLTGEGTYSLGATSISFDMTSEGTPVTGTLTAEGSNFGAGVSADGVHYSSSTTGLSVEASSAMLPFPVKVTLAQSGMNFAMPLSATEEPAPFAFGINLTDLAVNDEIWALVDPGAALPHDPATFVIGLTGTARLFVDLADPAQAATIAEMEVPGEVNSVSLDDLTIAVAGAEVSGTGAFTFDNSDTTTIPGVPRPEGKLELAASGINGLMDNLVAMGLLPEEQAMGARMMLGLFSVPTGDDQLTTTIEVNAEGQILANGQRLQ